LPHPDPVTAMTDPAESAGLPPLFQPEYLTFLLGGDVYALPIEGIREVVGSLPITDVPGMPPFLRGVMNVRGAVIPVLDLRARLGYETAPLTRRSCVLVHELRRDSGDVLVGVLVDAVQAVLSADECDVAAEVAEAGSVRAPLPPEYVERALMLGGVRTLLLDRALLLSVDDLKQRMLQ